MGSLVGCGDLPGRKRHAEKRRRRKARVSSECRLSHPLLLYNESGSGKN